MAEHVIVIGGGLAGSECALQLAARGVRMTARIVPDGEHCEASWEKQIPFFLPTLLYELEE